MASSKRHLPNKHTPDEIQLIEDRCKLTKEFYQNTHDSIRAGQYARGRRSAATTHRAYAPPQVTRGEPREETLVIDKDGKARIELARKGWGGDCAFLDWLNFTVAKESFYWKDSDFSITDDQFSAEVSSKLDFWFGFGITKKRDKGANFYERSWDIGDGVGIVCEGGQRGTVLISLSGSALSAAKPGWEHRLYDFLEHSAIRPRISRCDVAHDDFKGATYSVDQADTDFDNGFFRCKFAGKEPHCEHRGNWKTPNGKGRTLYVGLRKSGKYARIYEKGKQLGDKESNWVRIEVEFKSVDRIIPNDILLNAGQYLSAAYPAFNFIKKEQSRIATVKKSTQTTYAKTLAWLKRQCGPAISCVVEIEGSLEAAFEKIRRDGIPKCFDVPHFTTMNQSIHVIN